MRVSPGATENASSEAAYPAAWIRTPQASRFVDTARRIVPSVEVVALPARPRRLTCSWTSGRPAGNRNDWERNPGSVAWLLTADAAAALAGAALAPAFALVTPGPWSVATIASWAGGPNRYAHDASTKRPMAPSTLRSSVPWGGTTTSSTISPTGSSRSVYRAMRSRAGSGSGPSFATWAMTPPMPSSTSQTAAGARIRRRWWYGVFGRPRWSTTPQPAPATRSRSHRIIPPPDGEPARRHSPKTWAITSPVTARDSSRYRSWLPRRRLPGSTPKTRCR